jgi:hypothetical protein
MRGDDDDEEEEEEEDELEEGEDVIPPPPLGYGNPTPSHRLDRNGAWVMITGESVERERERER